MSIDLAHPDFIELKTRIRESGQNFVIVTGAGLSRPAGLPGWSDLCNLLIENARNRITDVQISERQGYNAKLDRLSKDRNLWSVMSELKNILPRPAYEECTRSTLTAQPDTQIPESYKLIWQLGVGGVINFNLDKLAIDAYSNVHHKAVDFCTAQETTKYRTFLSSGSPFVFHPHGIISDSSTWVLTNADYRQVFTEAYKTFMTTLFQSRHLLVIGFNPEDFSFKYLFENALNAQLNSGFRQYIVAPNPEPSTIIDYGDRGWSVIPYTPDDELKHEEVIVFLRDLLKYVPQDSIPPTVFEGTPVPIDKLPDDDELIRRPIPEIRELLNSAIASIIPTSKQPESTDLDKLREFYQNHESAIHQAWLVSFNPKHNLVHGYTVQTKKNRGSFGQVFEATDSSGHRLALKILHTENRDSLEFLSSFRRGVRSMRILTKHNIPRMVKFLDAFEVPACIIMELVDGPTLTEATNNRYLDTLSRSLEVLVQVGETVIAAHNIEEKVLHRDLKPDNVMLRNCFSNFDPIDTVVLDFDLSWHKGAYEMSIVHGARAQGYAAPEQTASSLKKGVSTRNTAVDVFGYGMVAFFVCTGNDPRPNEQNFEGFQSRIADAISNRFNTTWKSIPDYIAETISLCTNDTQSERIAMPAALDRFRIALNLLESDEIPSSHPIILEEIAVRLDKKPKIERQDFGRHIRITMGDLTKVVDLSLGNDDQDDTVIKVQISKDRNESDNRNVAKYIETAKDKSIKNLRENNFKNISGFTGHGGRVVVSAEWKTSNFLSAIEIDKIVKGIYEARRSLTLP